MSPTYRLPTPALLEMVERYQLSEECHHLFRQLKINTLGVSELRHVSSLLGQINRTLRGTRT